jgi:hypothetical protein
MSKQTFLGFSPWIKGLKPRRLLAESSPRAKARGNL